ncbi:MAG: chain-length determining protein [Nitrospirales bacterium]|nr:MAG: chain-length determining protein [Nitrospirales bacterium]
MFTDHTVDLRDYVEVLRRRRTPFAVVVAILFALSLAAAFLWPPTYISTATILIEEQGVPADFVRSIVTSSAVQRIETINQRVATRTNLMKIIEKYDLYANARAENKIEQIFDNMRDRIKVDIVDVDILNSARGESGRVAIAFLVSFEYKDPQVTQQVAFDLAHLFLEQNEQTRTARASKTLEFLTTETQESKARVETLETKLADFKEQNLTSLPELKDLNLRRLDHTEREMANVDTQIRALTERKFVLQGELAKISPWNPMVSSSGTRVVDSLTLLRTMKAEYVSASARYSASHPDVVRLEREITALEEQIGSQGFVQERARELAHSEGELTVVENKYAENHPDVIRLRREIKVLQAKQDQALVLGNDPVIASGFDPDNPAYITLRSRLQADNSELESLKTLRRELQAKLQDYESRITEGPRIEREYLILSREYESAVQRYQETRQKQLEARMRQGLESKHAEQFSLIDPPSIPDEPIKPNRPLIALLGLLFSLVGGVGTVALAEVWSRPSSEIARNGFPESNPEAAPQTQNVAAMEEQQDIVARSPVVDQAVSEAEVTLPGKTFR